MARVAQVTVLLLTLVGSGCADGPRGIGLREHPAAMVLTDLARHIRESHPSDRILVHESVYCGFPDECARAVRGSLWSRTELEGALRELGANVVQGDLIASLTRATADLVVAFGEIRILAKDRVEVVVRYERMGGAKITRVSMIRTGAKWSVEAEKTISTATYGPVEIR